jgi:hypothetical protein
VRDRCAAQPCALYPGRWECRAHADARAGQYQRRQRLRTLEKRLSARLCVKCCGPCRALYAGQFPACLAHGRCPVFDPKPACAGVTSLQQHWEHVHMHILITGGTGFIGSALLPALQCGGSRRYGAQPQQDTGRQRRVYLRLGLDARIGARRRRDQSRWRVPGRAALERRLQARDARSSRIWTSQEPGALGWRRQECSRRHGSVPVPSAFTVPAGDETR